MIEKLQRISDSRTESELWDFYSRIIGSINERTPLAQTLDREMFRRWLRSGRAVKLIARNSSRKLIAFAIVSSDLRHDPLISRPYFQRNFPGRKVVHFPVIAVEESERGTVGISLIREMEKAVPIDAIGIFFHSEGETPAIAELTGKVLRKNCAGKKLDSIGCVMFQRIPK